MAVIFASPTRQGATTFTPGVALAFEDAAAEPYFIAAGWAEPTDEKPVMTYALGEVWIDPLAVFGSGPNVGKLVIESEGA